MKLNKKQTDPFNVFVGKRKSSRFSVFLTKINRWIFDENYHSNQLCRTVFQRLVQKHKHLKASCEERTEKYSLYTMKNQTIEILYAYNSPSIRKTIDRPLEVKMQETGKIDQQWLRNLDLNRRNAERSHGREKENQCGVSFCEKASLRSPKT